MTRKELLRIPFRVDRVAASNGVHRGALGESTRQGWFGLLLLYGLAAYGGIRFVTDVAMPVIGALRWPA